MQLIPRTATSVLLALALSPLACASTNDPQETARKLLERGAYAEEHERDLAAAAELYSQALDAAALAGDAATQIAAKTARDRVLARQGTPVAPAKKAAPHAVPPQALRLLLEGSRSDPKTPEGQALIKDLAIAGASVVPMLETMFSLVTPTMIGDGVLSLGITPTQLQPNPTFAVYALAAIDGPEARAALERCYASTDPLVRHALVSALRVTRDPALLERAMHDPVASIAELAIGRLARVADLRHADVMEQAAKRGSADAIVWLARYASERLLALAEDRAISAEQRRTYLGALSETTQLPPRVDIAQRLLRLGLEPSEEALATSALKTLELHFSTSAWQSSPGLREPVGALVLAELERRPTTELISLLKVVDTASAPKALLRAIQQVGLPLSEDFANAIRSTIQSLPANASAEAFDGWTELLRNCPQFEAINWNVQTIAGMVLSRIGVLARTAPLDALARGARDLPTVVRERYARALEERIKLEVGHGARGGSNSSPGGLDPAILRVALAWLELDWERAAGPVAGCLIEVGDVEQLPLALDMYCNERVSNASVVADAVGSLIRIDPTRAAAIVEARLARLEAQPATADVQKRLRELGYVSGSTGSQIVQDRPNAIVRVIGIFPNERALTLFRGWYPKLVKPEHRADLQATLVSQIDSPEATAEIVRLYSEFISPRTRQLAVQRMGRGLVEAAIPLLGEALRDPDSQVRLAAQEASAAFKQQREALEEFAAWTIASQAQRESTAELIQLLASPNRDVVLGAVRSLAAVRASTALPALVKLLERNDPELNKAGKDAIARFGE